MWFARLSWPDLWNNLHQIDAVLSPYYVLLHLWLKFFGTSTAAARSLSEVFAIATVPAVYLLARTLFDGRSAVLASILCATSAFFVAYAQTARPYALEICCSALSFWAFIEFQRRRRLAAALAYFGISLVAVYIQPFEMLTLAAQLLSLPLLCMNWRKLLPANAFIVFIIVLLYAPVAALQLRAGLSQIDWIHRQDIFAIGRPIVAFAGSISACVVMVLCCIATVLERDPVRRKNIVALAIWIAFPIAVAWIASLYHPIFVSRYFASAYPPFVILVASGIVSIRSGVASGIAAIAVVGLSLSASWSVRNSSVEDLRGAALFVSQHATSRDSVVIFPPAAIFALREELEFHRQKLLAPIVYPLANSQSWSSDLLHAKPSSFPIGRYDRVWLVCSDCDRTLDIALLTHLGTNYVPVSRQSYAGVAVLRLDLRPERYVNSRHV